MITVVMLTNSFPVIKFDVDCQKKIVRNVDVMKEHMAKLYLPEYKNLSYDHVEEMFQYYMGGKDNLIEYLEHIEKHKFLSQYRINLRVQVIRN